MTSTTLPSIQPDVIDIDKLSENELRALVKSQLAIIESKKRLGINFTYEPDTSQEVKNLGKPGVVPYLVKKPALSTLTSFGVEDHILIEGDNLPAVTAYLAAGGCLADVIYIDPPYNTGEEGDDGSFVYNDRRVSSKDAYYHSAWLSFMLPRLVLGRDALRDTGVIIVHIGQDEVHRLRMLMDEVFGEDNFVAQIQWKGGKLNTASRVSRSSDYMLIYTRNRAALDAAAPTWRSLKPELPIMLEAAAKIWAATPEHGTKKAAFSATSEFKRWMKTAPDFVRKGESKHYVNIDENGELFYGGDLSQGTKNGGRFEVLHPVTNRPVTVPAGGWRATEEKMRAWLADGRILFGSDETRVPTFKRFLRETGGTVKDDGFYRDRRAAGLELAAMVGKGPDGKPLFNNPKDRNVLADWIDYVTPQFRKDESATDPIVVMDFFAGSGTTGHAVLQLNGQDDVRRTFVLITNNEDPKVEDFNSETGVASDVTSVRLRAAITGQWADGKEHEAYPANLHYYHQSWLTLGTEKYGRAAQFQGRFEGLAAVASGAHWTSRDLAESGVEMPEATDDFTVIRSPHNGGTTLVVWKNHAAVQDDSGEGYDDEPSGILRDFLEGNTDAKRIVYVPAIKPEAPFQVEGATETRAYPAEYLARLDATVLRLVTEAGLNFG